MDPTTTAIALLGIALKRSRRCKGLDAGPVRWWTMTAMERAHPLDDDVIEDQRLRQRLDLLAVPLRFVQRAAEMSGEVEGSRDFTKQAPFIEREVRSLADAARSEAVGHLVDSERADETRRFLASHDAPSTGLFPMQTLETALTKRARAAAVEFDPAVDISAVEALYRYLVLLLRADDLAPDGYRDPRLPKPGAE
jgi:hypothetical protein